MNLADKRTMDIIETLFDDHYVLVGEVDLRHLIDGVEKEYDLKDIVSTPPGGNKDSVVISLTIIYWALKVIKEVLDLVREYQQKDKELSSQEVGEEVTKNISEKIPSSVSRKIPEIVSDILKNISG